MRQSFEEEYQKQIREEEILPPRWLSKVVVILQQRRIMALQGQTQQSPSSRQGTVQTSGQSRDYAQVMEAGQVPVLIMGFDMTEYNPLIVGRSVS